MFDFKNMKILVTGGAGFIGSSLVDRLLALGAKVICIDNLILGTKNNIEQALKNENFKFYEYDLLELDKIYEVFKKEKFELIFHLAANSDIREGTKNTDRDLKLNLMTTYNVLECMRINGVRKLLFTSTPTVYGIHDKPLKEDFTMKPESLYGASKLAAEAFIYAFSSLYDIQVWIFRLSNMIGDRMTHGILFDFYNKIKANPDELEVLGNGKQCKPYMYVHELIDAFFFVIEKAGEQLNIFNIGPKDATTVTEIAKIFLEEMDSGAGIRYTGGEVGWKGDVPRYSHDASRLEALGWKPKMTSTEAVRFSIKKMIEENK